MPVSFSELQIMQYNTTRELMSIREYGRGVHDMVKYLRTIEDRETRQKNAEAIIEVMAILSPQQKAIEDYRHKLWDHLFLIADYDLDVDCPYPIPTREVKAQRPEPLPYPKQKIKWNHFGKTFEKLYDKAIVETDEEKKQGYIQVLALFMKIAYNNWHKENVHDDMIREELLNISKGQLVYDASTKFTEFVDIGDGITIQASQNQKPFKRFFQNNRNNNNNRNSNGNNRNNNNGNNRNANTNNNGNNRNNKFNRFKKSNNQAS
jgi:hypothetical protein